MRLDRNRILELGVRLGPMGAEDLISRAMEDLAVLLAQLNRAFDEQRLADMREVAVKISALAIQVGMPCLALIGRDVAHLTQTADGAALAAVTARLDRIAEQSLLAIWNIEDMSL